jgi:hypothetical protein
MPETDDDPTGTEARGRQLMADAEDAIVRGVGRLGPRWVARTVRSVLDGADGLDDEARSTVLAETRAAGRAGTERVLTALRALFALDPADQRATPLEVVRTLRREPTELLARAGVPPVERDQYETRSFPDDVYGIVPRSLAELGDDELGHQMLAWGIGKTTVLRARSALPGDRS